MSTLPPDAGNEQPQQPDASQPPAYQPPPADASHSSVVDPAVNITLNYWLSVFFMWIPALIFWVVEKDKVNTRALAFHTANLNFSIVRTGAGIVLWVVSFIPYIGWLLALVMWVGTVVLFVFHIIAAVKVSAEYHGNGPADPFIFNIPLVK